ncbi:Ribonuclease h domain, partial [Thalictrum thalictroides]
FKEVVTDPYEDTDSVIWKPNPNRAFTIKSAYVAFRVRSPVTDWAYLLWSKRNIPKHSFITWLAVKERLATQDKLIKWETIQKSVCALCTNKVNREALVYSGTCYGNSIYTKCYWQSGLYPAICNENHYAQVKHSGIIAHNNSRCVPQETIGTYGLIVFFQSLYGKKSSAGVAIIELLQTLNANTVIQKIKAEVKMRYEGIQLKIEDNQHNRRALEQIGATTSLTSKTPSFCKWEPPIQVYVMLNTNGSLHEDGGTYAGIIRNQSGDVIVYYHGGSKGCSVGFCGNACHYGWIENMH